MERRGVRSLLGATRQHSLEDSLSYKWRIRYRKGHGVGGEEGERATRGRSQRCRSLCVKRCGI